MRRRGFTLVEMLVVMALMATLAAMLFPAFAEARKAAGNPGCASNLRQASLAISMYASDADERYPFAVDPVERLGRCTKVDVFPPGTPLLPDVLLPYTRDRRLWRCPRDKGVPNLGERIQELSDCQIPGTSSVFDVYGSSYAYRDDLGRLGAAHPATLVDNESKPPKEFGSAEVAVLWDIHGSWHGGDTTELKKYEAAMADGHVRLVPMGGLSPSSSATPAR